MKQFQRRFNRVVLARVCALAYHAIMALRKFAFGSFVDSADYTRHYDYWLPPWRANLAVWCEDTARELTLREIRLRGIAISTESLESIPF